MAMDREILIRLACQRAGLSEAQVDALRRGDYGALLSEQVTQPPDPPIDDAAQSSLLRLNRRLNVVKQQRDAALGLLQQIAKKLGCCPRCWGTERRCPTCRGHGAPGFLEPDPGLPGWVGPALERLSEGTAAGAAGAGGSSDQWS